MTRWRVNLVGSKTKFNDPQHGLGPEESQPRNYEICMSFYLDYLQDDNPVVYLEATGVQTLHYI